jgi:hypothetical protein
LFDSNSFYLKLSQTEKYRAWCEMQVGNGGWEIVWRNVGGNSPPAKPVMDSDMVNFGFLGIDVVQPPLNTFPGAQSPGVSILGRDWIHRKDAEWIKISSLINTQGNVIKSQIITLQLGQNTMADIFRLGGE